ncbi:MAG: hypothetical protein ACRD8W_30120, partial [Nitrososphaeraceae archaeon]
HFLKEHFTILLGVVNLYMDEGAFSRYWTLKARTKKTHKVQGHALCAPRTWTLLRWSYCATIA